MAKIFFNTHTHTLYSADVPERCCSWQSCVHMWGRVLQIATVDNSLVLCGPVKSAPSMGSVNQLIPDPQEDGGVSGIRIVPGAWPCTYCTCLPCDNMDCTWACRMVMGCTQHCPPTLVPNRFILRWLQTSCKINRDKWLQLEVSALPYQASPGPSQGLRNHHVDSRVWELLDM